MYRPKYFDIEELVPQDLLLEYAGREHYLWYLFDNRVLVTADRLRARYGKINVNTWKWGGASQYRGFRPPNCNVGAKLSQHRFGRALDLIFIEVSPDIVRLELKKDPFRHEFEFITAIEDNISWFHFDTRNWNKAKNGVLVFNPT